MNKLVFTLVDKKSPNHRINGPQLLSYERHCSPTTFTRL